MTAKELSRFFKHDEKMAQDIEDHFSELRHWRLIRKDGEKCHAEERGKLWLSGRIVIPDCVYTVNGEPIEPPEKSPQMAAVSFDELCPPSDKNDSSHHVAPVQPTLSLA